MDKNMGAISLRLIFSGIAIKQKVLSELEFKLQLTKLAKLGSAWNARSPGTYKNILLNGSLIIQAKIGNTICHVTCFSTNTSMNKNNIFYFHLVWYI